MRTLLNIKGLRTYYFTKAGIVKAVDGVDLSIDKGEIVGIVGESGSGKSTLGLSILRLVPPPGKIISGSILFNGRDLLELSDKQMLEIRGKKISMIFQDPMSSLNPLMKVKDHLIETISMKEKDVRTAEERTMSLLEKVGISPERANDYPHQLSGGMRQRVMIALAIALNPKLVIADEPVTALDVMIQFQILDLLRNLSRLYGIGLMLITHDISIIAEIAEKVFIMYAGQIVESSDIISLFKEPLHPYTEALLQAVPNIQLADQKLKYIPGTPPDMANLPSGCRFYPRCCCAEDVCRTKEPILMEVRKNHFVRCFRYE